MPLTVEHTTINRVLVIDDKPDYRDALVECIADANLEAITQDKPIKTIRSLMVSLKKQADAAILDHRLKPGNYASFNGAEAVAYLNKHRVPAILVTSWTGDDIDNIRPFRRAIPVLIRSGDAEAKVIIQGFEQCIKEFTNVYSPRRQPRRTLMRIEEVIKESGRKFVYALIPGWNPDEGVRIPFEMIPNKLQRMVVPGRRFYVHVNLGAIHRDELYFEKFEIAEEPGGHYAELIHS